MKNSKLINVRGIVCSGLGQSSSFTEIPWVRKQFIKKLGIRPCPGTFNIIVLPEDTEKLDLIKNTKVVEITPEERDFCSACAFPALVNGKIKGAIIIPLVPNYPQDQLEVISPEHIRESLSLKDGDIVNVEIGLEITS